MSAILVRFWDAFWIIAVRFTFWWGVLESSWTDFHFNKCVVASGVRIYRGAMPAWAWAGDFLLKAF